MLQETEQQQFNVALCGAGLIGRRHAKVIDEHPRAQLACIIDPSEAGRDLAEALGTIHHTSIDAFFETGRAADGALIATPNQTHLQLAEQFLRRDVPCLIEKPLASSVEEARLLHECSVATGVPVLVGHHRRHHVASQMARKIVDDGALGAVVGAQITWMLRKPDHYFAAAPWRLEPGGGPVMINMIHDVDMLRYLVGEIVEVQATLVNNQRQGGVEDTGAVIFRCSNGALATCILSDAAPSPWHFEGASGESADIPSSFQNAMQIFGTRAALEFPRLRIWQHDHADDGWEAPVNCRDIDDFGEFGDNIALERQITHFCDVMNRSESPLITSEDGYRNVQVVAAIQHSALDGTRVTVGT